MGDPLILAHDIGTSGTKSSLVRPDGTIVASETSAHGTHFPRPGWAEQQPVDWWKGVCRNTGALTARRSELRSNIAGIGVSGHMLGCLPVDSEGKALRPCMIHSDYSDASHAQWLDIRAKSYATDVFAELGIESAKFPALHCSTDVVGKLTHQAAQALDFWPKQRENASSALSRTPRLQRGFNRRSQIAMWDKILVPLSRVVDPVLRYTAGKSLLGVWQLQEKVIAE